MPIKIKNKLITYMLLTLLIAVTGFPFFYMGQDYILLLFFISLVFFIKSGLKFDKEAIIIMSFFFIIELFQYFIVGGITFITITGTYLRLLSAYFIVKICKVFFIDLYINILYIISLISLFFYAICFIPGVYGFLLNNIAIYFKKEIAQDSFYESVPNFIIFSLEKSLIYNYRNPGPFWEPGAYSIFLNIALIFNLIKRKKFFSTKNFIFILSIITTFSTAGYIALTFIFLSYFLVARNISFKYLYIVIFSVFFYFIYIEIDFLSNKVNENIEARDYSTGSRFGSALADWNDYLKSPFIGWGRGENRYGGQKYYFFSQDQHRNNGLTSLLVTYGGFIFILYFSLYYLSISYSLKYYNFNWSFAPLVLIIFFILGFSQGIFLRPFFYSFLFLFIPYKQYFKKVNLG